MVSCIAACRASMRRTPPSLSGPAVSPRLAFQAPSLSADMEHIYAQERRQDEVDARMLPYSGRIAVPRRPERGRGLSDSSKVGAGSSRTPRACDAAVCWRGEARDTREGLGQPFALLARAASSFRKNWQGVDARGIEA